MSENTITLTDTNFNEGITGETPILVDFWAEWCGPCRLVAPVLDEIATQYKGKIVIGKLNVDENPRLSATFDVMIIPTMILFKDGVAKKRIIGARPKHAIVNELSEYLT
jgi:thioredoxin 1